MKKGMFMRLGGSVVSNFNGPEEFVLIARDSGFKSVVFPLNLASCEEEIDILKHKLDEADITIAEVGAWRNNPLESSSEKRKEAMENIKNRLALAERVGAACCVNIAGSLSENWDGPHMDSLKDDIFTLIVDSVREIIDAVKPKRTFYALETMPWMFPYDPDSYLRLLKAVDREAFGVHLDIINMINSPLLLYNNVAFTRECFEKLGRYIKSIHVKDITIEQRLTVHLNECLVGEGYYDFNEFFSHASKLDADMPVLVEHIKLQEDYKNSVAYLMSFAQRMGIDVK